ncbi:MAG: helix-turn-helix domain-containing protein [Mariniphaga sp.]
MLLYLSITGLILSFILLIFNVRKFRSIIYLGLFFLVVSLYGINQYVLLYSKSVVLVALIATNISFASYLIGPMLYWYIRSTLSDNSMLSRTDLWHLLPVVIYLTAALPYIFTPFSYKVGIAKEIVNNVGFLTNFKFTILSEIFSNTAIYLSRPILALGYTLWSIGILIQFWRHRSAQLVFARQSFMTKWLSFLLGFQLLLVITHLLSIFLAFTSVSDVFFTMNSLQVFSAVGLIGLLLSPFFFPDILYGLPRFSELSAQVVIETEPVVISEVEHERDEKISFHNNFESDYISLIGQKTEACMRDFKPFLDPDLNLGRFSDILQLPAHHLAYFFKEVKKQSFNDYSNECRVEYAKNLMLEGKSGELTLEAVGLLAGFSNRSTFFRAFKKAEGVSPGTFQTKINQFRP